MVDTGALFHCVCGADIPFKAGGELVCSSCGRRHDPRGMSPSRVETVVLSENGSKARERDRPSLVGQTFDHFRILGRLGEGGAGTVYRALDTSLERYVALKVLNDEGDPVALEAFVHEARAQARLNHAGIATIYYIGRRGETPYFAMEYVPGVSLDSRVEKGPLPPAEVIRIGIQAVRALREAHQNGITHRDIKPGNFIQTPAGEIKLTDFGLSKTEGGGLHITGSRAVTGTPYYIAPEQARGESTDLRTDIYSLGAMLYHLAYGKPPFQAENFMAVITKHIGSAVEFPEDAPQNLPAGFPDLIARMMAKRPGDRLQDYDSLERALRDLMPESQVVASLPRRSGTLALEWVTLVALVALTRGFLGLWHQALGWEGMNETVHLWWATGAILLVSLSTQVVSGRTPGKQFSRLRIAAFRGGRPGRLELGIRWCFQWLPALTGILFVISNVWNSGVTRSVFYLVIAFWIIDHLWAFTNRQRRTLHDLITGTWVLEDRGGPAPA